MERTKSRADVAVFVDFENVYVSVREKFDAQPNFELIMDRCEDYGRIVIARAYADWYRYPRVTSALFANGVEPMYVPTYHYDREVGRTGRPIKNSVDIHLCIDAMRTLYTQTHIDKFVLVTGDRDFIPLVNAIRQHGKDVIIIGIGGAASAHLAQSGDEFLFYEQIADLKAPQPQRLEQRQEQPSRPERRERERPERAERERAETNGRSEGSSRGDGNGKADGKRERPSQDRAGAAPAPEVAEPVAAPPERTFFDTLVDAINLARQRGFVSNLGSLKVLMRELDSGFHESKAKDSSGRPFSKFKDFVKEAERQGRVQIFVNGTVTEVFLPGEDPLRMSQFAEDLASQQVERELENELDQQAQREAEQDVARPEVALAQEPTTYQEDEAAPEAEVDTDNVVASPPQPSAAEAHTEAQPNEPQEQAAEQTRPAFGDREWQIFRASMSQFVDPVRFAEIFSALRGLRNQEVFDLTNNELKEMVKQAINRGMLQRTGRGARAYYRLSTQYRVAQNGVAVDRANTTDGAERGTRGDSRAADTAETPADAATVETAAGQASGRGLAPAARRRRGRSYDVMAHEAAPAEPAVEPSGPEPAADTLLSDGLQLQDIVADQVAVQTAEEPAPTKVRRNRRKKAPEAEAETPQPEVAATNDQAVAEVPAADSGENGQATATRKRRSRRKKTTAGDENSGADEATSE